jgi:hypothetical protein
MPAAKSQKGRKIGRNKKWCEAYKNRGQRGINKVAPLLRHIKRYGTTDHTAVHCYNNLSARGKPPDLLTVTPVKSAHKRIPPARPMNAKQEAAQHR